MKWTEDRLKRDHYENRLKWERDVSVMKKEAYEQGVREGEEKGRIAGIVQKIRFYQRVLEQSPTSTEQLAQMSLDDLRRIAQDLERQLLLGIS